MKILLIIFYILLSPLVPWSMAVSIASVATQFMPLPTALLLLWVIGFFEDVNHVQPFGITSFILITSVFVSWYLGTRYQAYARWWSLMIGTIGQLFISLHQREPLQVSWFIGQWGIIFAFILIRRKMFDRDGVYVGI